jgi:hypothetical protein
MRSYQSYPFPYDTLRSAISAAAIAVFVAGCAGPASDELPLTLDVVATPAAPDSGEPFLSVDGAHVYMSWLEASAAGGHDLRMARYQGEGWANTSTIAHSERFFVNWADFPSITRSADGALWAHWLERGAEGGYDYGVRIARSDDDGASWGTPWTPHDDDSPTEHGFVSTVTDAETIGFSWLDGRNYADGPNGEPATQEMSLRYRAVGMDGTVGPEVLLDDRVCDCCQTASAMTDRGPVVVYRNRTDGEIRDIHIVRMVDGVWGKGAPVHDDGWNIAGCPVNGPAVAARGQRVAVAWFTAPGDVARVKVAFSEDAGATFSEPTVVDDGNPAGRVDLVLEGDGSALVSWLERTGGEGAAVRLRRVRADGSASASASITSSSSERASGFPRMVEMEDGSMLVAWTDVMDGSAQVRVARIDLQDDSK